MGVAGDDNKIHEQAWDARVAKDLGSAYHEVGMEEYEERQRKGFKVKEDEFDLSNEEQDRLMDLMCGVAVL